MIKGIKLIKNRRGWFFRVSIKITREDVIWYANSILMLLITCIVIALASKSGGTHEVRHYTEGGIKEWISSFTSGDFETCDGMVLKKKDLLLDFDEELMGTNNMSVDMYKALLDACADSINEVKVIDGGDGKYTIKTTYTLYKQSDKVFVDEDALQTVVKDYISGKIEIKAFNKRLEELYYDSFKQTVVQHKMKKTKTSTYVLKEKDNKVVGVYRYVLQLMKDNNLYMNMGLFEESSESTFRVYLNSDAS